MMLAVSRRRRNKKMSLYEELKRRNVIRVAIAYLIAAWVVLQVSELVLETIEAPTWVLKVFLLLFALGMPIVLLFSWAYELTPEGIKREEDVDRSTSVTPETGKKLNQITIAMIVTLVAVVAVDRLFFASSTQAPVKTTATEISIAEKSIAVLAFEDLSPEGDQEYFADGLSEELLNVLAQIPDLQVAGRTSSFAFKDQNKDLREIGEILNVAHILEGSVRKAGGRIRVTAQLINAESGFHLFSQTYDRDLVDVFAVQDEIAAAISEALRIELIGPQTQQVADMSMAAYDLYLVARQKLYERNKEEMEEGLLLLDQAIAIDNNYAPALAQKALALILLSDGGGSYGSIPEAEAAIEARVLIDKALALDPRLAEAHAISALTMESERSGTWEEMAELLEYALSLNPNSDNTRAWLARIYGFQGRNVESRELGESIMKHDPLFGVAFNNLVSEYLRTNDFDLANAMVGRYERAAGENAASHMAWGDIATAQGDSANAVRHYRRSYEENPTATINVFGYSYVLRQLGEFESIVEIASPLGSVISLGILGRHDEARIILNSLTREGEFSFDLGVSLRYFVNARQYEEAVRHAETHFGDVNTVLDRFTGSGEFNSGYLAPLAYSYLQVDRESEYRQVTNEMANAVGRSGNSDNLSFWYFEAELAALTGTDEEVLVHIRKVVENGGVGVLWFTEPVFDRMKENSEYQELRNTLLARANAERAKLGLDPFLPIVASN
jgi:TolB-like protein/Tfp pilus assembly protein PilF